MAGGGDRCAAVGDDTTDGGDGADIVLGDNGTVTGARGQPDREPEPERRRAATAASAAGRRRPDLRRRRRRHAVRRRATATSCTATAARTSVHGETGADEAWGDADSDDALRRHRGRRGLRQRRGRRRARLRRGPTSWSAVTPTRRGKDTGDRLFGGPDNDRIYGDDVTITLGGNGRFDASDAVSFVPSADPTTYGDDVADGGTGLDEIHGQDGGDELWGAEDHDQIFGELGSDDLHGEGGPDYLVGDRGTITPGPRDVVAPGGRLGARHPEGLTRARP